MRRTRFTRTYRRFFDWLLRIGMARAVLVLTAIGVVSSQIVTAAVVLALGGKAAALAYGLSIGTLVPALIAPLVTIFAVAMVYRLDAAQKALGRLASLDALTGVHNRGHFMREASELLGAAEAEDRPLGVILVDLDNFKAINDTHGHAAGDLVLTRAAAACAAALPPSALFARFGGEEFIVLLPQTGLADTTAVAERLRRAVAALRFPELPDVRASLSGGVAERGDGGASLSEIINEADHRLYAAKHSGRDRIVAASPAATRLAS